MIFNWFRNRLKVKVRKNSLHHTPTQKAEDDYVEIVWREAVQRNIRKRHAEEYRKRFL